MNTQKRPSLIVACAMLLLGARVALAQGPAVDWWVISGGGAPSSGTGVTLNDTAVSLNATDVSLNDTVGQPVIGVATGSGDLALSAGYWANCAAAAAALPVVTVARSGADVVLTWGDDPNSAQYQVFISTDPYFDPAAVTPIVTTAATYTDAGAAASLVNHFYIVRGLNACGAASADSARTGEFTFGLTPGS